MPHLPWLAGLGRVFGSCGGPSEIGERVRLYEDTHILVGVDEEPFIGGLRTHFFRSWDRPGPSDCRAAAYDDWTDHHCG